MAIAIKPITPVTGVDSGAQISVNATNNGYQKITLTGPAVIGKSTSGAGDATEISTLPAAVMPALTGDVTSTAGAVATTLSNSGVTAGTYGSATQSAQITVDAKGRVTSATNVTITGGGGGGGGGPGAYGCRLANSALQGIPNATDTAFTFDTEIFDNGGCHSTVSNTSRITAPVAGVYIVTGYINYAASASGARYLWFTINGPTGTVPSETPYRYPTSGVERLHISIIVHLGLGDYLEMWGHQTCGLTLNAEGILAAHLIQPD